jgi:hypothetical protein
MAIYPKAEMRIDPKGTIVGYPALLVRRALRQLDLHVEWDWADWKPSLERVGRL